MQTRLIIDLEEFLTQLKEYQDRLRVRVTADRKSWFSRTVTVSGSTLFIDGEDGFAKRLDLSKAEVLERRDHTLFAEFKDGRTLELQGEIQTATKA